jgi:indolepyruvate ferredoxin oxidoreductase beta subunit
MNIVFAGVGGQGSITATAIVAAAARRAGFEVAASEVHGMSQRGGTVTTAVRYGREQMAPLVEPGEADVLVGFERLEAARHFHMLKRGGHAIVNDHCVPPLVYALQLNDYPADIAALARTRDIILDLFPATQSAIDLGDQRMAGVVLLGLLANVLDLPLEAWRSAIAEAVPARTVNANLAAFSVGEEWGVGPPSLAF